MKCLLQRVTQASVTVSREVVGEIDRGLLVLAGVEPEDTEQTVTRMAERLLRYRVFSDDEGKMNLGMWREGQKRCVVDLVFTCQLRTKTGDRARHGAFTRHRSCHLEPGVALFSQASRELR